MKFRVYLLTLAANPLVPQSSSYVSFTQFQTSSLPLSWRAKIAFPNKEKLNQSFKMFLCLSAFAAVFSPFFHSASIHPIISKELSFSLRIHPQNKSNPLSEKEHFFLFFPRSPSDFHFEKFSFFLSPFIRLRLGWCYFLCIKRWWHSDKYKSMDRSMTFSRTKPEHFAPKDLKSLFAVFHIKPHDDVVDSRYITIIYWKAKARNRFV